MLWVKPFSHKVTENPVCRIFPPCDSPVKSYINSGVKTEEKKITVKTEVIPQKK